MFVSGRNYFLFFIFLFPLFAFSSNNDSINKKNSTTKYFTANQFENNDSATYVSIDLKGFQNYISRNHLGNVGLVFNDLVYSPYTNATGFNYFKNNYGNYFSTPENIKFYDTRTPYTDLLYVVGSKREQDFKMVFSYNVKKNWNITANFFRLRSEGFYLLQKTNDNFISLKTNYKSKNNRYYLLASIIYNTSKNEENGGITNDSVFENTSEVDKKLVAVNLSSAKRSTINRNICVKQFLNLGKKSNDSLTLGTIAPESRLILTSSYEDNILKYQDDTPLSSFYSNIYLDSIQTFDSTYHSKIENELMWKRIDNKKHRGLKDIIGASFSVKHQLVRVKQHEIDTTFNNIIIGASLFNTYSNNKFWWNVSGKYIVNGFNKNDYSFNFCLQKNVLDSLFLLVINGEVKESAPDFIYNRFSSNNFKWNNNFNKTRKNEIAFSVLFKQLNLLASIDYTQYSNVLYFDNYALPRQFNGTIPVATSYLKQELKILNWHLESKIIYQYVPDSTVVRIPKSVIEETLYFQNHLFKNALQLQIGASVFYTSAYYSNAYMPATGEFYLQNNRKYGNYTFIDLFINAKIKTVRVFLKVEHLNSGFTGTNYIQTPNYPANPRTFKIGISWSFFD